MQRADFPAGYAHRSLPKGGTTRVAMADAPPRMLPIGARVLLFCGFGVSAFLQRIGMWVGTSPVPLALPVVPLIMVFLAISQIAQISKTRLLLFAALAGSALISLLFAHDYYSITSIGMYIVCYGTFIFHVSMSEAAYNRYYKFILGAVAFICFAGFAQWALQYVVHIPFLFSWQGLVPKKFLIEYNTLNKISLNAYFYKSNGFFLLEPSALSQLAARALLLSVILFRRLRPLIPFGLGLIVAYSGTGLILTMVFGAIPLLMLVFSEAKYRRLLVALSPLVIIVLAIFVWKFVPVSYFLGRTDEFSNPNTSGYMRFTGNFVAFQQYVLADWIRFLVGYGPGAAEGIVENIGRGVLPSCWIKLFLEYGLLGFSTFTALFGYCIYSSTRSWYLTVAFLFHFLFLDGNLLVPQHVFVAYFMYMLPVIAGQRQAKGVFDKTDSAVLPRSPQMPLRGARA